MNHTNKSSTMMNHIVTTLLLEIPCFKLYSTLALLSKEIRNKVFEIVGRKLSIDFLDAAPIKPQFPRFYRGSNSLTMVPWYPHVFNMLDNVLYYNKQNVFCPAVQQYALLPNEFIIYDGLTYYVTQTSMIYIKKHKTNVAVNSQFLLDSERNCMANLMIVDKQNSRHYIFTNCTRSMYIDAERILCFRENFNLQPTFRFYEVEVAVHSKRKLHNKGDVPVAHPFAHNMLVEVVRPWLRDPNDYMIVVIQELNNRSAIYVGYVHENEIMWNKLDSNPVWLDDCSTFTVFYKNGVAYLMFEEGLISLGHSIFC